MDLETSAGGNFDWQVTACAAEPKIRRGSQPVEWNGSVTKRALIGLCRLW